MAGLGGDAASDLLGELTRALQERARTSDPAARRTLDGPLLQTLATAASALHREPKSGADLPPRRVAVAMALALLSAPHFVATLPPPVRDGVDPGDPDRRAAEVAPIASNEVLERALGLQGWEIDELREEVDRRVGRALKCVRTVNWLWSFFNLREQPHYTLSRVLFPGTSEPGPAMARRGGHLYLLVDLADDSPHAIHLPWLSPDPALGPTSFRSRSVDPSLRGRVGRGVGADDEEVAELLESMVALVPAREPNAWLALDRWRANGYAAVTDLGTAYSGGDWLVRPIPTDGADWRAWIRVGPEGLRLKNAPEKVFDALALPRVSAMTRLLYASLLASVSREPRDTPATMRPEDVDLFDLPRHVRAVLAPLHAWAGRASTARHVAKETGRPLDEVARVFQQIRAAWASHEKTSWCGAPGSRAPSIQTLLIEHLLALTAALRTGIRRPPDPRGPHGDLMLLFAAHYLREARIERLWIKTMSDCAEPTGKIPPPEDIVGTWFFRAWTRVLDEVEREGPPAG